MIGGESVMKACDWWREGRHLEEDLGPPPSPVTLPGQEGLTDRLTALIRALLRTNSQADILYCIPGSTDSKL